jgi:maltose/moltooligosaccharide transporter
LALMVLPVVGYFSDRYRSSWGRRIPFLALTIPLVAISMPGIAVSPWLGPQLERLVGSSSPGNTTGVIVCLSFFWTLLASSSVLTMLLFAALANDVLPPRMMGRFFGAVRALTLLGGVVFNFFLFGHAETNYIPILLVVGTLAVVGYGLMCLKVREGVYPLAPPDPKGGAEIVREARDYVLGCFASPFYGLLFIAWALGSTPWNPVNYYSVLFSTSIITPDHYGNLLTLTFAISLLLAYPLGVLADRFHPLRLAMVSLGLYALAALWGGLCSKTPLNFDVAFVLHGVLSGSYMTATASLLMRLLPRSKFALFASAGGAMVCLWNIFIVPLAGIILDLNQHDYRCIYLLSCAQSCLAFVLTILLYRAYRARGGDKSYVPPGDELAPA